jgi:hydrogenase nickel incorporation protein HypB
MSQTKIVLARQLTQKNSLLAAELRDSFAKKKITVINILGSPGAGKTSLLEASLPVLSKKYRIMVIEGDLYTSRDAERIAEYGTVVAQINTEGGCHLDAQMIGDVLSGMSGQEPDLLFIENIGNLVCPAAFDLGEDARVVVLSVSEGDDKPEKYPQIFRQAHYIILNKIDLLPYLDFNIDAVQIFLQKINSNAPVTQVAAAKGTGLDAWFGWLDEQVRLKKSGG